MNRTTQIEKNVNEEELEILIDEGLSRYEIIVLTFFLSVLTTFGIIAFWSGILLGFGDIEGGGPLGMIMEVLPVQLLLK